MYAGNTGTAHVAIPAIDMTKMQMQCIVFGAYK